MRFRTNKIFEKNNQGKQGIGLGLVYPSAEAIEIIGMLGSFDFVHLDGEHGLFSPESIDADRENSRIQIFSSEGELLNIWGWVNRPDDLFLDEQENLYIAELGWSFVPTRPLLHFKLMTMPPIGHDPVARVTICDLDGNIQARFGGSNPILPGNFISPHGIWADSRGDIYVGEVVKASGAIERFAPLTPHSFQKFIRAK